MKILKTRFFLVALFFVFMCLRSDSFADNPKKGMGNKTTKILLLDSSHMDSYRYDPFIKIAESVGFEIDYKSVAQILDEGENFPLHEYGAAFFILGVDFLKSIGRNFVSHKILNLLEQFYKQKGKLLGLILPPLRGGGNNKIPFLLPIFKKMGLIQLCGMGHKLVGQSNIQLNLCLQKNVDLLFQALNNFLNLPVEARNFGYHTTLKMPSWNNFYVMEKFFSNIRFPSLALPLKKDYSSVIESTLPYGIYWFDELKKNHLFVTSSTLISFSGICESFHFCPTDFKLREQMHEALQRMFFELKMMLDSPTIDGSFIDKVKVAKSLGLPDSISKVGTVKKTQKKNDCLKKIGWMEIVAFEDVEKNQKQTEKEFNLEKEERKKKQALLMDYIYESGLDALWITFNPHMCYSSIGLKKSKKEQFLNSVGNFTKALNERAKANNVTVPKILVGFEIANNLYKPNLPTNYAIDLYGNEYTDLPSPLDKNFWIEEIKKSLVLFLKDWNDFKVSNGLKIAGVVLDLEMYCRKYSGIFTDTMGFESENFSKFKNKFQQDLKIDSQDSINANLLFKKKIVGKYFNFLEKQAESLGISLRNFFDRNIPFCFVACYAPNISIDWFYKGFYKGLCNNNKTIQLITFNTEFFSHEDWLQKNKISATHSSVLLLSKLKNKNSFQWVDYILGHHHGIWLNRFSRFVDKYDQNDWSALEQTPMSKKEKELFFRYLKGK